MPNGMLVTIRDISPTAIDKKLDVKNDIEKAFEFFTKHEITEYYKIDKDGKLIKL